MPKPPYRIDPAVLRRFDARRTAFRLRGERRSSDSCAVETPRAAAGQSDQARLFAAEKAASWTVHRHFHGAFSDSKLGEPGREVETHLPPYEFGGPEEAGATVKAVARRLGGCLAGIARVNPLWLYSHDGSGRPIELPTGVEFAVMIAVPMDPEGIRQSPGPAASAATGRAYSAMAVVASSVAEYIRLLGYRAISCGKDTALSIPLAIDAGLGVLGRNGLLLTREYGPYVRLCKVLTDLPLAPDEPEPSPPEEFCSKCRRCSRASRPSRSGGSRTILACSAGPWTPNAASPSGTRTARTAPTASRRAGTATCEACRWRGQAVTRRPRRWVGAGTASSRRRSGARSSPCSS